ncbi:MAG TPA: Lrp/AsnC family transcriptional regulator [Terriglobales bacterium]|nr:Lrp/AsnC family transcriptional regulator [Terriglobales bacterium]
MANHTAVDRISFELLRLLTNDGRLSNKQLAASVGLAPSSAHERLKQLRASGAYQGTHAEVDLKALGFVLEALIHIGLTKHKRNAVDALAAKLGSIPEVRQVFLVTGRFDLIVHVAIRDMEHLKNLAYDLTSHATVERLETSVVFEAWKHYLLPVPASLAAPSATRARRRRNNAR